MPPLPKDIETAHGGIQINKSTANTIHKETKCLLCRLGQKCAFILLFVILLLAAVAGLSIVFTGSPDPRDYFVPIDPPGKAEAVRWNAYAGLYLTMENACDDSWTPFFEQSFADWNETEALILSSRRVSYDATCEPSQGRLKVCNGDYGNTDWRGINSAIISVSTDYLVYSISKLNDFHLKTDDDKLYTMCHENGHGFGLPHTDEDHFNKDRGDCMDYTVRTWNNLKPGKFNLNLLETLYGTPTQPLLSDPLAGDVSAGGGTPVSPPTTSSPPLRPRPQTPQPRPNWGNQDEEDENEDDRRRRRQLHSKVEILMDTCQGAQCVYSIDDEYTVVINKLFV